MLNLFDDLVQITDRSTSSEARKVAIRGFAEKLRWTPSYEFSSPNVKGEVVDHLIVEHGLENSIVLSFLRAPFRTSDIDPFSLRSLLAISYNNLVEWHIFVSQTDIRAVNNLAPRPEGSYSDTIYPVSPSDLEARLSPDALADLFKTIRSSRSVAACDDALISVIARWKRLLAADIPAAKNSNLSSLFNAIIFVRGCEDRHQDGRRDLLNVLAEQQGDTVDLRAALLRGLEISGVQGDLSAFVSTDRLAPFCQVDRVTAQNLVRDFYAPREAPYEFDFALMSKHALSRIYERYVTILQQDETSPDQLSFIAKPLLEQKNIKSGAIYTPQFIAGFFARYIRENTTPRQFRNIRVVDPACGSGIFLRTVLELQCNPFDPSITKQSIQNIFSNCVGVDRDINAVEATRLSLALLYLGATGELPGSLNILHSEAIKELRPTEMDEQQQTYDAILTNPPYIKLENLPPDDIGLYREYLGDKLKGRVDAYLAFIKLALDILAPGGIVCFVLPQTFLNSSNGSWLRRAISDECDVRCLVDLSSVDVFEGVGAYSILLILQKRRLIGVEEGPAQICRATGMVGPALQAILERNVVEDPYFSVYEASQEVFKEREWTIIPPSFAPISERLKRLPKLSSFAKAVQGFVSGADSIFIRNVEDVPEEEREVYLPFLPDRAIERFNVPENPTELVFFPYLGTTPIEDAEILVERFPTTWAYLISHQHQLGDRRRSPGTPWWRPERPRTPDVMKRPKIVMPHIMLTSRFALDRQGMFAVSRSPFITAKETVGERELLSLLLACLNSSAVSWFIQTNAPKYANSYNRIEVGLLNSVPVPNLADVNAATLSRVSSIVRHLEVQSDLKLEDELDLIVCQLYGFGPDEIRVLRGEAF